MQVRLLRGLRVCGLMYAMAYVATFAEAATPLPSPHSVSTQSGISVVVAPSGTFTVKAADPAWTFAGSVGSPVSNLNILNGADSVGSYVEVVFNYKSNGLRGGAIRAYENKMAVLFSVNYRDGASNSAPFPVFSQFPGIPNRVTYTGFFALPSFGVLGSESPWVFSDNSNNAFILSPANNFMTASTSLNSKNEIVAEINPTISSFPHGFQHNTLLVISKGVNQAFEAWGKTMTDLHHKVRPSSDSDVTLQKVGYWTDAGSTYYYSMEGSLSYTDTLLAVKRDFEKSGVALGYLQLDSWFYPKGPSANWTDISDGISTYEGSPDIFPNGLTGFQQDLGIPLVTHSRWIDSSSPYRTQYQMSGDVVTDPLFWNDVTASLKQANVATFEQDWLGVKAKTSFNLVDPNAFLDQMAQAAKRQGITMQYCMPTAQHLMQGSKYSNLTTARVSQDRMQRSHWTNFIFASRLSSALGIWPFTDVFLSSETGNLIVALLSGGPVGLGDRVGQFNHANLALAARADGVIVKPDTALVPVDASYSMFANGDMTQPVVATTHSDFAGVKALYVFSYDQGTGAYPSLRFSDLGLSAPGYAYDVMSDSTMSIKPTDAVPFTLLNGWRYWILVETGKSGITLLGDRGQLVSLGKQRIPLLRDNGTLRLSVTFAPGETSRVLHGIATAAPTVKASQGSVSSLAFQASNSRFQMTVTPDATGTATILLSQGN